MGNNQKKIWAIVGVIVVLVVVIYFAVFYKKNPKTQPANNGTANNVTRPVQNLTPIKGALPPNFPADILVGSSPTISASGYTYDQKNSTDVWVVSAISTKSIDSFAQAYDAYFKTNKWTVVKKTQVDRQLYYFAFNPKTFENVNITINTMPDSLNNISITLKQPHVK